MLRGEVLREWDRIKQKWETIWLNASSYRNKLEEIKREANLLFFDQDIDLLNEAPQQKIERAKRTTQMWIDRYNDLVKVINSGVPIIEEVD